MLFSRNKSGKYLKAKDMTVSSKDSWLIPSGEVFFANNMITDGQLRNDGHLVVRRNLTINGELVNNGITEAGEVLIVNDTLVK